MEHLDVFVAWGVEERVVLRSSFHRPRFAPEGADVDELGGAGFDEAPHRLLPFPRLAGVRPEAFVARAHEVEHAFEADVPDGLFRFGGGALHQAADQVEGDQAHPQGLVRHGRAFHGEELHAQRGLEIAQLQLDVPAAGVEVGQLDAFVFPVVGECRDQNQLALLLGAVFVGDLDETDFDLLRQRVPLHAGHRASGGLLRTPPCNESFVPRDPFPLPPVQGAIPRLV